MPLFTYSGVSFLILNVARRCGLSTQYEGWRSIIKRPHSHFSTCCLYDP
ncbi:MAG: hypothetical protein IPP35_08070 [Elusimicrobia bacterium]|nr:hypothetical protein [Elusimicrobiota bacterium]